MRKTAVAAIVWLASAVGTAADTFHIAPGKPNLVRFESKAPLETFDGKTRAVQGSVTLDPTALGDSIDVRVDVDLATLDTGISLRNKHMRENHLETDKYPQAVFHGGKVTQCSRPNLAAGTTTTCLVEGTFGLHGVDRRMQIPVELTRAPDGKTLRIVARFPVALADHRIPRPGFLVMKLQDVQQVTVELVATAAPPGP